MPRRPAVLVHPPAAPHRRSNAAAPIAGIVLLGGLILGAYTIIIPAILGLFLLSSALSFLSTRINPLSIGFYLDTKPSWPTIALMFLSGIVLVAAAYGYYRSGFAPILPS